MEQTKTFLASAYGKWSAWFSAHPAAGSRLRRIFSVLILALSFSFVAVYLARAWSGIQRYPWEKSFDVRAFSAATVLLLFHYTLNLLAFRFLLRKLGGATESLPLFRILLLANMGKYIPGKFWAVMGKGYLLVRQGVNATAATRAVLLDVILGTSAGLFVCFPLLGFALPLRAPWLELTLCAWLILPGLLGTQFIAGRFRRLAWVAEGGLSPSSLAITFGLYAVAWVVFGFSFWMLVKTVAPVTIFFFPHALAAVGNAWLAGFAVLLAPAGLGVREGVLLLLLKSWLPLGVAAVLALGTRVWMTLGELLALAIVHLIPARGTHGASPSSND
jgi:glycosyltransferase 2 family protein